MDSPNYGTYDRVQDMPAGRVPEEQVGLEERLLQTPRYLEEKRSYTGSPYGAAPQNEPISKFDADRRGSIGVGETTKTRKGSLRYAVRRIFGRRSREPEPQRLQTPQVSPPRHAYHQSATPALPALENLTPGRTRDDGLVQRTLSTPTASVTLSEIQRTRSPYAMQFPHSARLKPLDLGNPYTAPGSQLRRRKSLPSLQMSDSDATALATNIQSRSDSQAQATTGSREVSIPYVASPESESKREKRRSRSAGDLRGGPQAVDTLPRKRSEETRGLRESFHGSVLRASGFLARSPSAEVLKQQEEDRTTIPRTVNTFESPQTKATPPFQRESTERDFGSASAFGAEFSQDLEERVARLEAGLLSFRGQLSQLSADRNRRTVLIGGVPTQSRDSSQGRSASMLATDLQQNLEPSGYQYDYPQNVRPSTAASSPRTPTRIVPPTVPPTFSFDDRPDDDPFVSPSKAPTVPGTKATRTDPTVPPQYTFRSLYEMLADERSARRKLEKQMIALREEIANLHYQVSFQSNVQSQRSSYYAPMDPMVGSSRLRAMLRDTETDPSRVSPSNERTESAQFSAEQQGLVSRFSASESEIGGTAEAEELQTPHDAYQTPQEDQGSFPFAERTGGDEEMF